MTGALWPTGSRTQPRITDGYGPRVNIPGARPFHYGADVPMPRFAPVRAAQDGQVIWSGVNGTLGEQAVVRSAFGVEFLYPHMTPGTRLVRGTWVRQGDTVGLVGTTGLSTGPHVCFRTFEGSWQRDADARNPVDLMARLNSASTAGLDRTQITKRPEGDEDMPAVIANGVTNVWALVSDGRGEGIAAGKGTTWLKVCRQDAPIVLGNAEFAEVLEYFRSGKESDYDVYANVGNNVWYVLGPGFEYQIPSGQAALWESIYGPRRAISDADYRALRAGYLAMPQTTDIDGIAAAIAERAAELVASAP